MKYIWAAIVGLMLLGAGVQTADAHHGHDNLDKPGHQIKEDGRYAGELSPGHEKHHGE